MDCFTKRILINHTLWKEEMVVSEWHSECAALQQWFLLPRVVLGKGAIRQRVQVRFRVSIQRVLFPLPSLGSPAFTLWGNNTMVTSQAYLRQKVFESHSFMCQFVIWSPTLFQTVLTEWEFFLCFHGSHCSRHPGQSMHCFRFWV